MEDPKTRCMKVHGLCNDIPHNLLEEGVEYIWTWIQHCDKFNVSGHLLKKVMEQTLLEIFTSNLFWLLTFYDYGLLDKYRWIIHVWIYLDGYDIPLQHYNNYKPPLLRNRDKYITDWSVELGYKVTELK